MDQITRRRAAKYVILKAAPFRTFQVSARLSSTSSQFLPGPNSTGRRSVTFIHHFLPKFNFLRNVERRNQFPCSVSRSSRLQGVFPPPLLLQPSARRVLTSAGCSILPCSGHVKPQLPRLSLLERQ